MSCYEFISVFLSIIAVAWAGYVFVKNRLYQTAGLHIELRKEIDNCSSAIAEMQQEYRILSSNDFADIDMADSSRIRLDSAIKSYLNKFEDGCAFYIKGKLDKEHFMDAFGNEISIIFKTDTYMPYLDAKDSYPYLKMFYNQRLRSRM